MIIRVPIRTISEANRSRHEHWATTAKRVKSQRLAVERCWRVIRFGYSPHILLPCVVTLVRIAPRKLDEGDNLPRALKAVRDAVAAELGVDDRDPRVIWRYEQRRGRVREHAVEIRVESAEATR